MLAYSRSIHCDAPSVMVGFIGSFRSLNIMHLHPDVLSGGDQALTCVPAAFGHGSPIFIQICLKALSAASVASLMALLLWDSLKPSAVNAL